MKDPVVVVGGGIGGMVAALRARRHGAAVTLVEARSTLGGLASPVKIDGTVFDGGPYILLDRQRLGWALAEVGVDLDGLEMLPLDPAYTFEGIDGVRVAIHADLDLTSERMNEHTAGSGHRYRRFVERAMTGLERLAPLLVQPHSATRFVTSGAWRASPWVLPSLQQLLTVAQLPDPAATAVSIWTLVAGGSPRTAPGPTALVPALIHRDGAVRPVGGIHTIVSILETSLEREGVTVLRDSPVASIVTDPTTQEIRGVTLEHGDGLAAGTVISDVGGAAALLDLLDIGVPRRFRRRLKGPLQSPGMTAYLRVRGPRSAEIRFRVGGTPRRARAFIHPAETDEAGWAPCRLIAPLSHDEGRRLGPAGQRDQLDRYVAERWWRCQSPGFRRADELEVELVATRTIDEWSRTFRLRDDAMNLAMARRQMLEGRLPHTVAAVPGLHLTGSWTHPGQWISFCAVSGVLAADAAMGIRGGSRSRRRRGRAVR